MKRKHLLKGILLGCLYGTMLIGCSSTSDTPSKETERNQTSESTSDKKKPVTLTVLANQDWVTKPYMKAAWENYEKKTGNKLDIQAVPIDSGESIMKTKFATGEIPDIFMHFGGYGLKAYKPEENFVDFSDAEWVDDLESYAKGQATYNDKVYGLPHWEASISGMIYNKEIFDELGIDIPQNQAEFEAACETIQDAGITPIYLAFKDVWPFLYQFAVDTMMVDSEVLNKLNSNELTYADIPEFRSMVEWYKKLADNGYVGEKFTTNTWDGAPEALGSGEYAMMYAWDSWVSSDLEPKYPGEGEKFGIMPAFQGTPDQGTYEGPNICLTFANKNSKHAEEAIEFINFLADPENYNIAFEGYPTAPVFKGQTTHVPTTQFTESKASIDKLTTDSIAWGSVIGFTQTEGAKYLQELMIGNIDVDECIRLMDEDRMGIAKAQKTPGF